MQAEFLSRMTFNMWEVVRVAIIRVLLIFLDENKS